MYTYNALRYRFEYKKQTKILIINKNDEEIWSSITTNQGSVSHLDFLSDEEIYKWDN